MRRVMGIVLLGVLAFAIGRVRQGAVEAHQRGQRYEDIYYLPSASALPVVSLGFHDALAQLVWCRSLVYFGEELGHRGVVKHVFEYADAVIALAPDFRAAYRWVATAAVYRPTAVSMNDGLRAATYLERALERWPDDGELHWDYGSLLRFELAPLERDPAKKQRLLERAAPHLELAARRGAGPPWLALSSVSLLERLGRMEQAIRHLEELQGTVREPAVRAEIDQRLALLRSRSQAEASRVAYDRFAASHRASYPYLSEGLFLMIGPRPPADAYAQDVARRFVGAEDDDQRSEPTSEDAAE